MIVKFGDISGHVGVMSNDGISDGMDVECDNLGKYKVDMGNRHLVLPRSASLVVCVLDRLAFSEPRLNLLLGEKATLSGAGERNLIWRKHGYWD